MLRTLLWRPLLALTLGGAASLSQAHPAPRPTATLLKAGTVVVLETTTALSSEKATMGQNVGLRVKYAVVVDGRTVIAQGAPAAAQVADAQHRRGVGKQGNLSIKPTMAQAVDGQALPLVGTTTSSVGDDKKGASIGLAVAVSPLFLLKKGKEATIPAGFELQATVANDTTIQ